MKKSCKICLFLSPREIVLSVACQFYDPTGLAAPLIFPVCSLYSNICWDRKCSMNSVLKIALTNSAVLSIKFWNPLNSLSLNKLCSKVLVNFTFFFDRTLQGYGSCICIRSQNIYNLLYSTAKVMGKSAFSAPHSEMSSDVLAVKIQQKIRQEMYSIKLSSPVFIVDSEIVLRMVAKNNPADLPFFYGTRVMEIIALKNSDIWFWCPGPLNPADLLTRSGSTLELINSDFWLQGSFLSNLNILGQSRNVGPSFCPPHL